MTIDAAAPPTQTKRGRKDVDVNRYYTATQFQLIWWRFRKHRLAMIGSVVLAFYLIVVVFAEIIAPYGTQTRNSKYLLGQPQPPRFVDSEGNFHLRPFVYGSKTTRNKETLRMEFSQDTSVILPLSFFYEGEPYKLWGLIPMNIHLVGLPDEMVHFMGTDELGRDLFSRLIYGTRVSLSIGVLGVLISFILGLVIGGISGYWGGWLDYFIQRLIEFIRSIPTLPLWMALSAAFPKEWPALRIYFAITILLSLIGWTNLARRVRGKLLSLRSEDFVVAAVIAGSSDFRIITRHLLPSFLSYIIVDLSVSFPYMILGETALSFVGLGLRPPIVSWGTLLQASQNIRTISQHPWLFLPAIFVILAVLAFSFVGDGLRDAADPYSR
ncbi:MAG: ABC transporter permease [Chloroflexi bacterium]|nr:ABC transporter permease [Chloroflexota bacterium]